jgi:hypothetical protein
MLFTITDKSKKNILGGKVDRDDVLKLVSHFRDNQYASIPAAQQAKFAFFTRAEIEQFLNDMPEEADGIRIYFGAVHRDLENGRTDYRDRMTVVIVGTQYNDILDVDEELLDNNHKMLTAVGYDTSIPNPAYDFATLCPPDCGKVHRAAAGSSGASIEDDVYRLHLP